MARKWVPIAADASYPLSPLLHFHLCGEFHSFNSSQSITSIYVFIVYPPTYLHNIYTDIFVQRRTSAGSEAGPSGQNARTTRNSARERWVGTPEESRTFLT